MSIESNTDNKNESAKLAYDIYKHLITLNTGSIVILVTLLEKLFTNPEWKLAIAISLCSFVISIFGCLGMLIVITMDVASSGEFGNNKKEYFFASSATLTAWGGFLIGIISIVIFAIKNIY